MQLDRMTPAEYAEWLEWGMWEVYASACLLAGYKPPAASALFDKDTNSGGAPAKIYRHLKESIDTAKIRAHPSRNKTALGASYYDQMLIEPPELIAWATSYLPMKRYPVPEPLAGIGLGGPAETPEQYRARVRQCADELKKAKVRAWRKQLATKLGISPTRVYQLLQEGETKATTTKPTQKRKTDPLDDTFGSGRALMRAKRKT